MHFSNAPIKRWQSVIAVGLACILAAVLVVTLGHGSGNTVTLVGTKVVQPTPDNIPAGQAEAYSYTSVAAGTATDAQVDIASISKATKISVGVYADSTGKPGALLSSGSLSAPKTGWNNVPMTSGTITSGTTYWIALMGTGGTLNVFDDNGISGSHTTYGSASGLSAMPNPYKASATWHDGLASVYVNGTPPTTTTTSSTSTSTTTATQPCSSQSTSTTTSPTSTTSTTTTSPTSSSSSSSSTTSSTTTSSSSSTTTTSQVPQNVNPPAVS